MTGPPGSRPRLVKHQLPGQALASSYEESDYLPGSAVGQDPASAQLGLVSGRQSLHSLEVEPQHGKYWVT